MSWLGKIKSASAKKIMQVHKETLHDTDRFICDRYELHLVLEGTVQGYSLGFQINASQLGVASTVFYWHYEESELEKARKTFNTVKKISAKLSDQFRYENLPFSLTGPMFKHHLCGVDIAHQEKTGIYVFDRSTMIRNEPDWRETIYGSRYPKSEYAVMKDGWINADEGSKEISQTGDTTRSRVYRLTNPKG